MDGGIDAPIWRLAPAPACRRMCTLGSRAATILGPQTWQPPCHQIGGRKQSCPPRCRPRRSRPTCFTSAAVAAASAATIRRHSSPPSSKRACATSGPHRPRRRPRSPRHRLSQSAVRQRHHLAAQLAGGARRGTYSPVCNLGGKSADKRPRHDSRRYAARWTQLDPANVETIRLMAVERVREGEAAPAVIASYGFNRTTIYKRLAAASDTGCRAGALTSSTCARRPRSLTPRQEQRVFRGINGKDPRQYGLDFGLWTRWGKDC